MKAITILQPYASLIACGAKKIETRSWKTSYRGKIAIHAGKNWPAIVTDKTQRLPESIHLALCWKGGYSRLDDLPMGSVIAIAELVDCQKVCGRISLKLGNERGEIAVLENDTRITGYELEFGDLSYGRYAWILANARPIKPVPAKGKQRLWEWENPYD